MEENFNPYASPKADVTALPGPPRRPRSVKWATFVLGFMTAAVSFLYWQTASAYGSATVWNLRLVSDPIWLIPIGFVLCLFRRRDKISFGFVALLLGWMACRVVVRMLPRWTATHAFATFYVGERVGEMLATFGLVYLFYRFTFGLPSRTYFGMVRQAADEQRPRVG